MLTVNTVQLQLLRKDDTSRFAKATADAVFPSASAFWLISNNEDWFSSSVFDTLKLRVSYGELGSQQIGGSNLDVNISLQNEFTAYYPFSGSGGATPGATLSNKGNPLHTWGKLMIYSKNIALLIWDSLIINYKQ